jgi:hypothetical protein
MKPLDQDTTVWVFLFFAVASVFCLALLDPALRPGAMDLVQKTIIPLLLREAVGGLLERK